MKTTEYTGNSAAIKGDCPWLASEDILDKGDIVVVIEACNAVQDAEFEGGRKEDLYTLSFVGAKKQLILNSTNRKILVMLYGTDVGKWKGQPITLYVEKGIRCFGEIRNGLRIRNKKPPMPKSKRSKKEEPKPDETPASEPANHSAFSYEGLFEAIQSCTTSTEVEMVDGKFRAADLTPDQMKELGDMIQSARETYQHGDA